MRITSVFVAAIAALTSTSNAVSVPDDKYAHWSEETYEMMAELSMNAIELSQ